MSRLPNEGDIVKWAIAQGLAWYELNTGRKEVMLREPAVYDKITNRVLTSTSDPNVSYIDLLIWVFSRWNDRFKPLLETKGASWNPEYECQLTLWAPVDGANTVSMEEPFVGDEILHKADFLAAEVEYAYPQPVIHIYNPKCPNSTLTIEGHKDGTMSLFCEGLFLTPGSSETDSVCLWAVSPEFFDKK